MKNEPGERRLCKPSRVVRLVLERGKESMNITVTLRAIELGVAHDAELTFTGVSDVRFRGERTELTEIVSFLARDVSRDGLEGIRFLVRDDEEEFMSFACRAIEEVEAK
jgi:hypothetical protein